MPGKVLVADDSLKVQRDLTQLLQQAGVEVVTVSNGEHAVRKLPAIQPDLVIADCFMPVRDGYEVCDFIKNAPEFSRTRVLLLIGKMEPYDNKRAQQVRADGKLEKPFEDLQAVLAAINQHLGAVLATRPAAPAPAIEEFSAAVPEVPAEAPAPVAAPPPAHEPEPEPEAFATRPPPVTFETQTPLGFADMMAEEPLPPARVPPPPAAAVTESEEVVDLSQATMLSSTEELQQRIREERLAPPEAAPAEVITPAEEIPAAEPAPEEAPTVIATRFEPVPSETPRTVEKPELAAAWEMTGPEPGAPEIPAAGGWDSQWKDTGEAVAEEEELEEEPLPAEPAPAEAAATRPYAPEEFAAAMAAALGEPVPAAPPAAPEPPVAGTVSLEPAAPTAPEIDPVLLDAVVERVLQRLSPQVMETIAREIVRPLAEAIIREQLQE
ncbi:MAG: response regulator [Acidobacteria bacterium]|nr:response regulator [Acidobacteriota bacterium]